MICKWRTDGRVCGRDANRLPVVKFALVGRAALKLEFTKLPLCPSHRHQCKVADLVTDEIRARVARMALERGAILAGPEALTWGRC